MNAAWCGISEEDELAMCLSPDHKTVKNILAKGAFTVNIADADHVAACDYVGMATGNDVADKFAKAGFTAEKGEYVDAPVINELKVCIECKLRSYDPESCFMLGEIVNVSADESAMTDGRVDVSKVKPITFDPFNNTYHVVGEKVGDAWGSGTSLM